LESDTFKYGMQSPISRANYTSFSLTNQFFSGNSTDSGTGSEGNDEDGQATVGGDNPGLSPGAIGGIVVGGLAFIVFLGTIAFLLIKRKRRQETSNYTQPTVYPILFDSSNHYPQGGVENPSPLVGPQPHTPGAEEELMREMDAGPLRLPPLYQSEWQEQPDATSGSEGVVSHSGERGGSGRAERVLLQKGSRKESIR
jgi:hypothetical protein